MMQSPLPSRPVHLDLMAEVSALFSPNKIDIHACMCRPSTRNVFRNKCVYYFLLSLCFDLFDPVMITTSVILTIIVAVCVPCSPPPQHSPIFGHFASSQTVANFRSRNCCLIFAKFCPIGIFVFNQGGKRKRSVSFFSRFSLPSYSCHWSGAASGFCWTKS